MTAVESIVSREYEMDSSLAGELINVGGMIGKVVGTYEATWTDETIYEVVWADGRHAYVAAVVVDRFKI